MDVRRSLEDPAFDASVNVVGTINVLEAARRNGTRRLVNTSTGGAIYGETDVMPTPETVIPAPVSAYGQSKQCAEQYCAWAGRLYGLEAVTLRYGNVYGPRQDPGGEAGVVAIFAGRLLDGTRPTIFGDGTAIRDYTFVADIVAANLAAADAASPGGPFNVGTGVESSVLDVVAALREAAGGAANGFEPEFEPARVGELAAQLARRQPGSRGARLHGGHLAGRGHAAHARPHPRVALRRQPRLDVRAQPVDRLRDTLLDPDPGLPAEQLAGL